MGETYDAGPVAALRRIAFLMERGREDSRRIEAFRSAAATILPLPAEEVAARAEAGTLTELSGIGPSTSKVITDAVRGVQPERLAKLEAERARADADSIDAALAEGNGRKPLDEDASPTDGRRFTRA